jgi:hypothetical protein
LPIGGAARRRARGRPGWWSVHRVQLSASSWHVGRDGLEELIELIQEGRTPDLIPRPCHLPAASLPRKTVSRPRIAATCSRYHAALAVQSHHGDHAEQLFSMFAGHFDRSVVVHLDRRHFLGWHGVDAPDSLGIQINDHPGIVFHLHGDEIKLHMAPINKGTAKLKIYRSKSSRASPIGIRNPRLRGPVGSQQAAISGNPNPPGRILGTLSKFPFPRNSRPSVSSLW